MSFAPFKNAFQPLKQASEGGAPAIPTPLHYWDLATDADDAVGDWDWTEVGNPTYDATGGPDGGACIDLDSNDYLELGAKAWDGVGEVLSICVWAKMDVFNSAGNWLFSWRDSSEFICQIFARQASTNWRGFVWDGAGSNSIGDSTTSAVVDEWRFICFVHDGTDSKIYIDGVLEDTTDSSSLGNLSTNALEVTLGTASWAKTGASTKHDGSLAKVGIWEIALSAANITALYNSGDGLTNSEL